MKRIFKLLTTAALVAVVALMVSGTVAMAQGPTAAPRGSMGRTTPYTLNGGTAFVDANQDGVCDYLGTGSQYLGARGRWVR